MPTRKNTLRTILSILCPALTTVIILLASANLILPYFFYLEPDASPLLIVISAAHLYFAIILLVKGFFIPDNGIVLSRVFQAIFSLFKLITGLLQGRPGAVNLPGRKIQVEKSWNASTILIISIVMFFLNVTVMIPTTGSETFHIVFLVTAFVHTIPFGWILAALSVSWFLLTIASWVLHFINTKEEQVPSIPAEPGKDTVLNPSEKNVLLQCVTCNKVYHYDHYDGICPKCGTYNKPSSALYMENKAHKKKAATHLYKIVLVIVLLFPVVIIAFNLVKFVKWINIPEQPVVTEAPLTTFNPEQYSSESFTSEEVNQLLKSIEEENNIDILSHKEIYTNNEEDEYGQLVDKITIIVVTQNTETLSYFQYYKYPAATETHKAGEIIPVPIDAVDP